MKGKRKKILVLLLALSLLFTAACAKSADTQQPEETKAPAETQSPAETQTPAEAEQPGEPEQEAVQQPEQPEESGYSEYNAKAEEAYRTALETFAVLGTLPGSEEEIYYSEYADGDWSNRYAILDIDGDGKDELVLRIAQTITAAMQENIYAYDEETGELVAEMAAYPLCEYFQGGKAVKSGWSHGTGGENPDFWPFNVFYYNEETDEYEFCGYCAQASLKAMEEMGWADRFPSESDKDGDGVIYEITNETTGNLDWVDEDGYQFWLNNMFGSEPALDIPWSSMEEFVHPNGDPVPVGSL